MRRDKALFLVPAAIAAMLAIAPLLHRRAMAAAAARLDAARRELRETRAVTDALRRELTEPPAARSGPATAPDSARTSARIPADASLGPTLESLSASLQACGITAQELVTGATVRGERYLRLPVTLRFQGTALDAYAVLRHIERSPRLLRVERLTIDHPTDKGPSTIEIEFSAFALPPAQVNPWQDRK